MAAATATPVAEEDVSGHTGKWRERSQAQKRRTVQPTGINTTEVVYVFKTLPLVLSVIKRNFYNSTESAIMQTLQSKGVQNIAIS